MKKLISLILALVMVMGLAVSASAASITITPKATENGTVSNVTYTAYKILDVTMDTTAGAYTYTIQNDSSYKSVVEEYLEVTAVTGENYSIVTEKADFDAAAFAKAITPTGEGISVAYNEKTGKYESGKVDEGYYLITDSMGSALILKTRGDEEITAKNEYPTVTKTQSVTDGTAYFGQEITYTVTVKVPATATNSIVIHDAMTNLTYTEGSVEAKAGDDAVTVTANTAPEDGCTLEITFDAAAQAGKTVVVTYKATVNANAKTTENKAHIVNNNFTSVDTKVDTKNYKVDVYKYTQKGESKTGLAGAGFVLKNADGKFYKLTEGKITWVDSIDSATELTSSQENNYIVTFDGLANGNYTLVEKTVPAGYNKADDQTVTINGADMTGETQVEVLNSTGSELPSTGGMGTTLFYVLGGLMMVGAAVVLVTKKRVA